MQCVLIGEIKEGQVVANPLKAVYQNMSLSGFSKLVKMRFRYYITPSLNLLGMFPLKKTLKCGKIKSLYAVFWAKIIFLFFIWTKREKSDTLSIIL